MSSLEERVQANIKAKEEQKKQIINTKSNISENPYSYKVENEKLLGSLNKKQFGDMSSYERAISKIAPETKSNLDSQRLNIAKYNFKQEKGYEGSTVDISNYLKNNELKIEKNLYGNLTKTAKETGLDMTNDAFYNNYLGKELKSTTPKEEESSILDKTKGILKGIFLDTPVGIGALASDTVFGTNLYKDYFGNQTKLKGNEGFGEKFTDLMIDQGAIIDAGIALGSFLSGGLGAPALISAKTAIKGGLKTMGKGLFKTIEKGAVKDGAKLLEEGLTKKLGEGFVKAIKGEDDIAKVILKDGAGNSANYLTKAKIAIEEVGKDVLKENPKAYEKFVKQNKSIFESLGASSVKLSKTEKQAEGLNIMIDALGLPNFIGFKAVKDGSKELLKYNKASFVKTMVNYALPASPLLPGVGDWMQSTGLRLGSALAGKYTELTRTGLVETERSKFKETYGVDPEKSTGELRKNWENYINFKLKNSTISESLTGVQREDRSLSGQWGYGILDTIGDFIGPMLGIKAIGKTYGVASEKLSPITMDTDGNIVSNINYIKALDEINKTEFNSDEEKRQAIDQLNTDIESGKYQSFTNTIKSAKELETIRIQLNDFLENSGKQITEFDKIYMSKIDSALEEFGKGNIKDAQKIILDAENFQTASINSILNDDRVKGINQKVTAISNYFDKMRNSFSLTSELTKGFVTNFFTKDIKSPSGAIIRGTDTLVAKAKSIFQEIDNRNQKIVDIYSQRKEALGTILKGESGNTNIIKSKIVDSLKNDGLSHDDAMTIADVLHNEIHNTLTETFLQVKGLGDYNLGNLFSSVFTDFGLTNLNKKVKEVTDVKSKDGISTLITKLRGEEGGNKKLSSIIESMMRDDIQSRLTKSESLKEIIGNKSRELLTLNNLKADIASKINQGNEYSRAANFYDNSKVNEINIDEKVKQLEQKVIDLENKSNMGYEVTNELQNTKDAINDLKEAKENGSDTITEREPISKEEEQTILNSPNIEGIRSGDAFQEKFNTEIDNYSKDADRKIEVLDNEISDFSQTLANIFESHTLYNKKIDQDTSDIDYSINNISDNFFRNTELLNNYESFFLRSIDNYNDFSRIAFNRDGTLDLSSLKNFDELFINKLRNTWDTQSKKLLSELTSEEPNNARIGALNRMLNSIQEEAYKGINRDNLLTMSKESLSVEDFASKLYERIRTHYGFTPEIANQFLVNTFGGKDVEINGTQKTVVDTDGMLPMFNLYKNTHKIDSVKIDLTEGKVIKSFGSPEEAEHFLDANGNDTYAYRTSGIEENKINKDYDIVFVNDIIENNKSINPKQFFITENDKNKSNKDIWNDELFPKVEEQMQKEGYFFLGSFQEEGKKMLFLKPKEGIKGDWNDAMYKLTGVDFTKINKIKDFDVKNQIMSNFSKYAKLLLWGEVRPDNNVFKEITGRDEVIHLVFDDKQLIDNSKVDVYDGRTLSFDHYQRVLNKSIGANIINDSHKTATSVGEGIFIKSKDGKTNSDIFLDKGIRESFEKFFNDKGLFQDIMSDTNWFQDKDLREIIHNEIIEQKLIDRLVPLSALKNIYTRKLGDKVKIDENGKSSIEGIQFKNYQTGQSFTTPIDKIGLKTHDETKFPEETKSEEIKISNQFLRNINIDYNGGRQAADIFYKTFNDIRQESYDKIIKIINETGNNPMLTISRFEKEFNIKFTDFEKQSFITEKNSQNIINMASNLLKNYVTTGVTIKGNKLDLTFIPDYENVRNAINEKIGEDNKDNFIILDKEFYPHLEEARDSKTGLLKFTMFRYPIVSRQVLTAPIVIWKQDLSSMLGYEYNPHIGSAVAPSHKITKRVEGDGDGDSLYLITDDRFTKTNPKMFNYIDAVFKDDLDKNVDSQKANMQDIAKSKDWNAEKLFKVISFDTFEGKANIGMIDTDYNKFETYVKLGMIKDTKDIETIRFLLGETNQKAVDNKTVDVQLMKKQIEKSMGTSLKDILKTNSTIIKFPKGIDSSKIRIQTGENRKGEPIYKFLNDIKFTNENKAIDLFLGKEGVFSGIIQLATNKQKDNKGFINISLDPKVQKAFMGYDVDTIKNNISNIYNFIGKYDYSDGIGKAKSIANITKDYQKVKLSLEFIKENFPEAYSGDPQISFIETMGSKFERGINNFKEKLSDSINKSFQKEMINYDNFGTETIKGGMDNVKQIINNYRNISWLNQKNLLVLENTKKLKEFEKAKLDLANRLGIKSGVDEIVFKQSIKKGLGKLKEELYNELAKNPNINSDNIIIQNSGGDYSKLFRELLTNNIKSELNNKMTINLYKAPIENISKIIQKNVDIEQISSAFGKTNIEDFKKVFENSIINYDKTVDTFNNDPYSLVHLEGNTGVIMSKLHLSGLNNESINKTAKVIQTLPMQERKQVFEACKDLGEQDIKALSEVLGDSELDNITATEILNLFGIKEISNKMIIEDVKNAKPILKDNPIDFINNPC